jgi:hypothetical protein
MRSPASFPLLIWLSLDLAPLLRKPSAQIAARVLDLGVEDRCEVEVGHFRHEQVPCAKRAGFGTRALGVARTGSSLPIDAQKIFGSLNPDLGRLASLVDRL